MKVLRILGISVLCLALGLASAFAQPKKRIAVSRFDDGAHYHGCGTGISDMLATALVKSGKFREDLYYRLNLINIHLPALRDRKEDIPLLINHFNAKYSKDMGKKPLRIPVRVMDALEAYLWPGNVRELENFIHRLVIMKDNAVAMEDLPDTMKMDSPERPGDGTLQTLAEVEKQYIQRVLESTGQNKTKAAEILGIDRKTLREKLK